MAVTRFGIVYSIATAQVRRYIYPTLDDSEITNHPVAGGEAVTSALRGPYVSSAAWYQAVVNAVTAASGMPPSNPRCCVIDGGGNVVNVIHGDPSIDAIEGMTLVNDLDANIGWTWVDGVFTPPPAIDPGPKP